MSSLVEQTTPWRLRPLPIIALETDRAAARPVLALASPSDQPFEEEEDCGMRKSQLPTLPGPLWAHEESPTLPMFERFYS